MEGIRCEREGGLEEQADGWRAWEAAPRDGPGIFVVDAAAFDDGRIQGRWLDPDAEPEVLYEQVRELLGREPVEGAWAVIDQVGLGPLMVPETMGIDEVGGSVHEAAVEGQR